MPSPLALGALLVPLAGLGVVPPRTPSAGELARAAMRLGVVGNVLYVAAHPDDENTRLLAWLAQTRGVRAAYLSMTRGDGGQNLIGPEQGPRLGLIRTQELLAARRVDGAEQFFTRALDFGYSKSADETLAIWGKDEILSDVVRVIRRFHPDVIVTRFSTVGGDTHGHHTASAILAGEAFKLAADASYRPDLGPPWQARRLVYNKPTFFLKPGEDLSKYLKMDIGAWDPLTGESAGEIAAASRSNHKSQGFGAAPQRGPIDEYFEVIAGEALPKGATSFLDGIDMTWKRVPGGAALADKIAALSRDFDPQHPAKSIPALVDVNRELSVLPADDPWRNEKMDEVAAAFAGCAGIYVEATAASPTTTPGAMLPITLSAIMRAPVADIELAGAEVVGVAGDWTPHDRGVIRASTLKTNVPVDGTRDVHVQASAAFTEPYWLVSPPEKGRFAVENHELIGDAQSPSPLVGAFSFIVGGKVVPFLLFRPVAYKWTDPVHGERWRPIEILPPATVTPAAPVSMFPDGKPRDLRFVVKASAGPVAGSFGVELPQGWKASAAMQQFKLDKAGDEAELHVSITPPAGKLSDTATLHAFVTVDGKRYERGLVRIDHPHIPVQTLLPPADVKLVRFDLRHARTRIAYVPGAGDEVAASLRQVGYDVTLLDDRALASEELSRYQAIVLGVRAFNVNEELVHLQPRLLDYVAAGGTLVVQYNTNNRLAAAPDLGPYPFKISQKRVTDENAAVQRRPSKILEVPNKIADADFAGWVQERGLYFADGWDPRYEAPLAMHDPGEPPAEGSLLVAHHGKGVFVYTGLSFFRQLPAGVPGAYRLLANLIDAR